MQTKQSNKYTPQQIDDFGWSIAEGRTDAYPYEVRIRHFPSDFPRENYPIRLNVFWSMRNPLDNGLASQEDVEELHTFENRLNEAEERTGAAILTVASSPHGALA